jgi:protein O-mannosyl-transferase
MGVGDSTVIPEDTPGSRLWYSVPVVAIVAAYAAVVTGGFVWDDYYLIVNSPLVTTELPLTKHFTEPFSNNPLLEARLFYRPLITLSYRVDHCIWSGWPGGFHLTNLLLHSLFALLLALICRRGGVSRPVAALLATLSCLMPRLTESVAWISGRTDIAAGLGVLAVILLWDSSPSARARRLLAGGILFLALLCKEIAVVVPMALLVPSITLRHRENRLSRLLAQTLPLWLAVAAYLALRVWAMGRATSVVAQFQRPVGQVLLLAGNAVTYYAWMLLNPFQPKMQIGDADNPSPLLGGIGVLIVAIAAVAMWKWRDRLNGQVRLALALAVGAVAFVSHIIPLNLNIIAADRFLYLPMAAIAIAVAKVVDGFWRRRQRPSLVVAVTLVALFATVTAHRARAWTAELRLWRQALAESTPGQPLPRIELASALMRRSRFREALVYLEQVPSSKQSLAAVNIATCLDKLGLRGQAIALVEAVVRTEPRRLSAQINLMLLYARALRFEEARAAARRLMAEFADNLEVPPLVRQMERTMADLEALPAESASEGIPRRVERATLYSQLGALPEALSRWQPIAFDAQVGVDLHLKAASYIAMFGPPELARDTLSRLDGHFLDSGDISALRALFDSRFDDE